MPLSHLAQTKQKIGRLEELMQRTMRGGENCAERGIRDGGLQLKLARTRTEVLSIGQLLQDGAGLVDPREGDAVTAPVDFNALLLQGEGDDQSGNGDSTGEGSGGDAESLSTQNSQSGVGEVTH